MTDSLPPLPLSWSELTWQQLCECWHVKACYAGNADAARVAALLTLCRLEVCPHNIAPYMDRCECHEGTGEVLYTLHTPSGRQFATTARELSQMAKQALPWFDFPYGDMGDKEEKNEQGEVVKERRDPHPGYVNPVGEWRDALAMPQENVVIRTSRFLPWRKRYFALPQVALNNLTWYQYRQLQGIVAQIFQEGATERLQAQFLASALTPRSLALFDTSGGSIRFRLHWEYRYDADRADWLAKWWDKQLERSDWSRSNPSAFALYHICFQAYQTAMQFYEAVFPDLFGGPAKHNPLHTALTGESDTIVAVMDEGGFTDPKQVYEANLPFILSILNRMAKKAKEIEQMRTKIKRN